MYSGGISQSKGSSFGTSHRGRTHRKDYQPPKRDNTVDLNRSNTKRLTPAKMSEKR